MNNDNIDNMQREAMRRVQEMNSRAQSAIPRPSYNPPPKKQERFIPQEKEEIKAPPASPPVINKQPKVDILSNLLEDKERNLILILILILSSENADTSIILALMYLII